ncbi:hypothetical protein CRUP_021287 [Coryphaenoides rupestris]|nr:hypothetical protein CRUP_021287 [Coryphaenoides rupestris]
MKAIAAAAALTAVLHVALCLQHQVTVLEGDYTFSLEDVKVLWHVLGELKSGEATGNAGRSSRLSQSHTPAVCSHPALPDTFRPLCQDPNAEQAFANLENLATRSDSCEICESVACFGC